MKTKLTQMTGRRAALALGLLLVLLPGSLTAQVPAPPQRISYQGYLWDAAGVPVGNLTPLNYDAVFRIYDVSSAGTALWTEQQTITIDRGYFSVLLGEGSQVGSTPHPALDTIFSSGTSERYVGVTVKGLPTAAGIEIAPRVQLLTAPYAMTAANARVADQAKGLANPSGTVALTVVANKNIGVGKTTPQYPLDVVGDIQSSATVRATTFVGALDASNLTGIIPPARLPADLVKTGFPNTFVADQTVVGTVKATKFHGMGSVPVGGIILWSGLDRTLDAGWKLCTGQTVTLEFEDGPPMTVETPDLRGRFVMGSTTLYATNVASQASKDIRQSGGSSSATLTAANLPAHNHSLHDYYWLAHLDSFNFFSSPGDYLAGSFEDIPPGNGNSTTLYWGEAGSGGGAFANRAAFLTHTTDNTGSSTPTAIPVLPPYYKLAYIMRIK